MNSPVPAPINHGYHDVIVRAAQDPNFDVDKLERLVALQEQQEQRAGDKWFNDALAAAEAEMGTISTDAANPQTRSRYATFARLDGVIRPIYTKHRFSVSFTTEPATKENEILVVGYLSNGGTQRRYQLPVPIDTKGMRGQDMMTRTHATMSAVSYGKRNLLVLMFNLSTDDDDGNRAGGGVGKRPPPEPGAQHQAPRQPFELIDPKTGEVVTAPIEIPLINEDYGSWGKNFVGALNNLTQSIEEIDRWVELNHDTIEVMQKVKPPMFEALLRAIGRSKERFLEQSTQGT